MKSLYSPTELKQFRDGIDAYRVGDYYNAHEAWEELWSNPALPSRRILQGFIQIAVSLFHAQQGNLKGSRSMMNKALQKFESAPASWNNIHLQELIIDARKWHKHIHTVISIEDINFENAPTLHMIEAHD